MSENEKTYQIVFKDGTEKRITVPSNWKVAFGPCVAGTHLNGKFEMPLALRFYEDKENQRAIFTDVKSVRDMSIKITEKKIVIQEEQGFVERKGVKKVTTFQARSVEWVDPDVDSDVDLLPPVPESDIFTKEDKNDRY